MVPTFSDWQISLTFAVFLFPFSSVLFNDFNKYKNVFKKYTPTEKPGKNNNKNENVLKFPHFSSILGKITPFFQYFG